MNRIHLAIATLIATFTFLPQASKAQEQAKAVILTADSISFHPHPPEKDAQIAILYGNPREEGHFVISLQFAPD